MFVYQGSTHSENQNFIRHHVHIDSSEHQLPIR